MLPGLAGGLLPRLHPPAAAGQGVLKVFPLVAIAWQAREKQIAQLTQQLEQACRERDARAASGQATPAEHAE